MRFADQLSDQVLIGSIEASADWHGHADVPDPLDHADVRAFPESAAATVRRRLQDEWCLGQPQRVVYPKPGGGHRYMTGLDPYADIAYRVLVAPVVPFIEGVLGETVLHTRCFGSAHSWRARSWKTQQAQLRSLTGAMSAGSEFEAEAHLDVAGHYGSIDLTMLRRLLYSTGAPDHSVNTVVEVLQELSAVPGQPRGLPMGPEASAPLGTVALLGVDRRLEHCGVNFVRWMDDFTLFLPRAVEFANIVELVSQQLMVGGQALNEAKTEIAEFGANFEMNLSGLGVGTDSDRDPAELLEEQGWAEDSQGVTFALGGLRVRADPRGLPILKSHPWILSTFPRQSASYIRSVADQVESWDFILGLVFEPVDDFNAGAQLWLPRVLPMRSLGQSLGSELFEHAMSVDRSRHAAVANELTAAAGRSAERKRTRQSRAIDVAEALSDLNAKRAAMAAFGDKHLSGQARRGLTYLRRIERDLDATVRWAGLDVAA